MELTQQEVIDHLDTIHSCIDGYYLGGEGGVETYIEALKQHDQALRARLAACEKKSDEEMLRVKACEHIAEGEPEWEKFREICPSTMAVASLQDRLAQAEARVQALEQENARLREALISIATNTCCDSCREAALVAQHALEGG